MKFQPGIRSTTIQEAIRLYQEGESTLKVAAKLGISRGSVSNFLNDAGIKIRYTEKLKKINEGIQRGVRICSICQEEKLLAEMMGTKKRKGGVSSWCLDCRSKKMGSKNRRKLIAIPLESTMQAYLAALVDGEGCISLVSNPSNKRGYGTSFSATVSIHMTGTALRDLRDELNFGALSMARHPNRKPIWTWTWSSNVCRAILPQLLAFLRWKRGQAQLLMEYLELCKHLNRKDDAELLRHGQKACEIAAEIRRLNDSPGKQKQYPLREKAVSLQEKKDNGYS